LLELRIGVCVTSQITLQVFLCYKTYKLLGESELFIFQEGN